jgi:hypothetical protein
MSRLRLVYQVVESIGAGDSDGVVPAWFRGLNPIGFGAAEKQITSAQRVQGARIQERRPPHRQ